MYRKLCIGILVCISSYLNTSLWSQLPDESQGNYIPVLCRYYYRLRNFYLLMKILGQLEILLNKLLVESCQLSAFRNVLQQKDRQEHAKKLQNKRNSSFKNNRNQQYFQTRFSNSIPFNPWRRKVHETGLSHYTSADRCIQASCLVYVLLYFCQNRSNFFPLKAKFMKRDRKPGWDEKHQCANSARERRKGKSIVLTLYTRARQFFPPPFSKCPELPTKRVAKCS